MQRFSRMTGLKACTLVLGALCLAACSVGTPPTITSTQTDPLLVKSVELISETQEGGLRSFFKDELTRAMAVQAVSIEEGAKFVADFSVSQRPVELGLQPIEKGADASNKPSSDFESHWLDKCKPNRVSASLVVYSREGGEVQAKSSGEFIACPGDHSQLGDLAQLLVNRTFRK